MSATEIEIECEAATQFEDILEYWFGGNIEENYNVKWFPSSTSGTQKKTDEFIQKRFGDLLDHAEKEALQHWKETNKGILALIVLLDQFSRHIHRNNRSKIDENDKKALDLSEQVLVKGWDSNYNVYEFVFLLMPFRHQATGERLEKIVDLIDKRLEEEQKSVQLLEKFRKTTFRRLQDLQVCFSTILMKIN